MSRLKEFYKSDVAPALMKKFNYKSPMQIPRLEKVIINCCESDAKDNSKIIDNIIGDLTTITGQKAIPTLAKKSVSNFKLRAGIPKEAILIREICASEFIQIAFHFMAYFLQTVY